MRRENKCEEYKNAISNKYPSLSKVDMVGDRVKILIQKSRNNRKQNAIYNGWKSNYYVTNLFVLAPDGLIVACMLNCPDFMPNSELAALGNSLIYQSIDFRYDKHHVQCVMGSAFATAIQSSQFHENNVTSCVKTLGRL